MTPQTFRFLFLLAGATALTAIPVHGELVAHWPLDETSGTVAGDTIGVSHGSWEEINGVGLTWGTASPIGTGADFAGGAAHKFIINNDPLLPGTTGVTFSAWINPDSGQPSGYVGILTKRNEPSDGLRNWGLALEGTHTDNRFDGQALDSDNVISDANGWYHIAAVWENTGAARVYINGVEKSGTVSTTAYTEGTTWRIGDDWCCNNREFNGQLDDLAMWNEALKDYEVIALYQEGLNGISAPNAQLNTAPVVTVQPVDAERILGDTSSTQMWMPSVAGTPPLSYQWRKDTVPMPAETNLTLSIVHADMANYDLVVVNALGAVTSTTATVTEILPALNEGPQIVAQGASASFSITMPLGPAYTYQWKKDGVELPTETAADISIINVAPGNAGFYSVEVSLNGTTLESNASRLVVELSGVQAGLVAYWPLDETSGIIAEDVFAGNDGVLQDATGNAVTWTGGLLGGSASLNGQNNGNSAFEIAEIPALDGATQLTIAGWFNPNQTQSGDAYKGLAMTRSVEDNNGQNRNWGLAWEVNNQLIDGRVSNLASDSSAIITNAATWYHVALTWDASGDRRLYVNGAENGSETTTIANTIIDSGTWWLGRDGAGNRFVRAQLDDWAFWDRVLTPEEANILYLGGLAGFTTLTAPDPTGPPVIIVEPADQSRILGDPAAVSSFEATVVGAGPFSYQWRTNGVDMVNETDSILGVVGANTGPYDLVVSSSLGSVTSRTAFLIETLPPITPDSRQILAGDAFTTSILMPAGASYSYQWKKDTAFIDGETGSSLTIPASSVADTALYSVDVTFNGISRESNPVSLTVAPAFSNLQEGMIGHWPFDDGAGLTVTDTILGNNGNWRAGNLDNLTWVTGQVGGAARLNGVNNSGGSFLIDELQILDNSAEVTISGWVNADPVQQGDIYKGIFMTRSVMDNTSANSDRNYGLAMEAVDHVDGRISGQSADSSAASLTGAIWQHIALAWNGSSFTLYVNGVPDTAAGGTSAASMIIDSGSWEFGRDPGSTTRYFGGSLDDFALWRRTLDSTEIARIYNQGLIGISVIDIQKPPTFGPEVNISTFPGGFLLIEWPSESGYVYDLQSADQLVPGSWTNILENIQADPPKNSELISAPTNTYRAYRVGQRTDAP